MEQQQGSLEVHAPGGLWARLSGISIDVVLHIVIIALLVLLLMMVMKSDKDREIRYMDLQRWLSAQQANDTSLGKSQDKVLQAVSDVVEEQRAMTYVLTLSEQERKALKMTMPASVRNRMRRE